MIGHRCFEDHERALVCVTCLAAYLLQGFLVGQSLFWI
jgi:hypothetical protein